MAAPYSIYDNHITQTDSGKTIPFAEVTVSITGLGLATLYYDRDGLSAAPNPFPADENGRVQFYLESGRYQILASDGAVTISYPDVLIGKELLIPAIPVFNAAAFSGISPVAGFTYQLLQHTSGLLGGGPFRAVSSAGLTVNLGTIFASFNPAYFFQRYGYDDLTLEMFGGGLGGNDQVAWLSLYSVAKTMRLLDKDYRVDNLRIRKAFTIKTSGFNSRLVQNAGVTGTEPDINQMISVITVAASDVSIEDISLYGTIDSDIGEDRHGIRVDASRVPGGISKIRIGNVSGANMRGDIVVTTGSTGRNVSDFTIGNIFGFNFFRNGYSLVSGINGKVGVVSGSGEGLFMFDSEPDSGGAIVENVFVAGVKGRHCGVPAVTSVQRGITFGFVDLDFTLPTSTPPFTPVQDSEKHGLVYRSTNGCHIEECILKNFPESPIRVYKEPGDDYVDNISFGNLTIVNCLTDASSPPSLIRAAGSKNIRVSGTLKYTCTNPALHELILDGATTGLVRLSANRIEGDAPIGRYVAVDSQSSKITYTQDRTCINFIGNCTFNNAEWNVGIVSASSIGLITFTSSVINWTGSFKYADGLGTNFHTYELNCKASPTVGATPTWAPTRVDV